MKIVVTDGHALNHGDLSWQDVARLGELEIYPRTSPDLLEERCTGADIILSNKTPISSESLNKLPKLKMIGVLATGFNVIDVEAAREKNIIVCNVPGYGTHSVAQHTIALMLELTNRVGLHADSVRKGDWENSIDWSYSRTPLIELYGKTLGIIGLGNIGRQTARIADALGMKIIYFTPKKKTGVLFEWCEIREIFKRSDFISLHCPLTTDNEQFVNRDLLGLMKTSAFLINTARGALIREQDLADALNEGRIAGAALDVLSAEPPYVENPLLSARACIITPHNAWMTKEARERIIHVTAENISRFLQNDPIHVVN